MYHDHTKGFLFYLLISTQASNFSKAVNLFEILTWFCTLPSTSFMKSVCLFTHCQSLPNFRYHQIVVSQSAAVNIWTSSILECHLTSIKIQWPLSIIYDILSVTDYLINCWYDSLKYKKKRCLIHHPHFPFRRQMYNTLLGDPTWPPVPPLNLTWYIFHHSQERNCPIQTSYIPCTTWKDTFSNWP
jgi:hypothetical protein